jgi:hypothetical protein
MIYIEKRALDFPSPFFFLRHIAEKHPFGKGQILFAKASDDLDFKGM